MELATDSQANRQPAKERGGDSLTGLLPAASPAREASPLPEVSPDPEALTGRYPGAWTDRPAPREGAELLWPTALAWVREGRPQERAFRRPPGSPGSPPRTNRPP